MSLVEQLHGVLGRVLYQAYGARRTVGCLAAYIPFGFIFFLVLNDEPRVALKISFTRWLVEDSTRGWLEAELIKLLQS